MENKIIFLVKEQNLIHQVRSIFAGADVAIQIAESYPDFDSMISDAKYDLYVLDDDLLTSEQLPEIVEFLNKGSFKYIFLNSKVVHREAYGKLEISNDFIIEAPFRIDEIVKRVFNELPYLRKNSSERFFEKLGISKSDLDKSDLEEKKEAEVSAALERLNDGSSKVVLPSISSFSFQDGEEENADQIRVLNQYLKMKEDENQNLRHLLESMEKKISDLQDQLKIEMIEKRKLLISEEEARTTIRRIEQEKSQIKKILEGEIDNVTEEYKDKIEKLKQLEKENAQNQLKYTELKERVKQELRKNKLMLRELENKLELQKRDSLLLLRSKDDKLIELQKQLESVQFDYEALKEKLVEINKYYQEQEERVARVVQTMKLNISLLDKVQVSENSPLISMRKSNHDDAIQKKSS